MVTYADLANQTSNIDFGCDFTTDRCKSCCIGCKGNFNSEKGCTIPRPERPKECLIFHCKKLSRRDRILLNKIKKWKND